MYLALKTHPIVWFLVSGRSLSHAVCGRNIHSLSSWRECTYLPLGCGYVSVTCFGQSTLAGSRCDMAKGLKVLARVGLPLSSPWQHPWASFRLWGGGRGTWTEPLSAWDNLDQEQLGAHMTEPSLPRCPHCAPDTGAKSMMYSCRTMRFCDH